MEKRTSGKARDFRCSLCTSCFNDRSNLRRHIRGHVKEKVLQCNQCTYKTWNHSNLTRHVNTVHEQLKPFKCPFPGCNHKAAQAIDIQRHRLTHETDPSLGRPFPCTFEGWNYRATLKSNLVKHIQSQHNENRAKSVLCSMCPAAFYTQHDLRVHVKGVHVKQSVHHCSYCEYKTSYAGTLTRHMKNMHGGGDVEVTPKKSTPQPAKTVRRRQKINPENGANLVPSDETASEPKPPTRKYKMKTVGRRKAELTGEDSLRIFTCTMCHFTAKSEKEALEHSAFRKDHILMPNCPHFQEFYCFSPYHSYFC